MSNHPVALITGASQGIGHGVATKLASLGYYIAALARNEQALRRVRKYRTQLIP